MRNRRQQSVGTKHTNHFGFWHTRTASELRRPSAAAEPPLIQSTWWCDGHPAAKRAGFPDEITAHGDADLESEHVSWTNGTELTHNAHGRARVE
ncbi:hypothetical protein MOQ72_18230 [Saccharopolyspora sp. K220]|uniref:hypothetical protein n=1 Tax=Saccharopolyspora soli TaxID=2926618 RepID=UPI001F5AFBFF|nr:hypothetical protein [Saccharopolyspora soli]MCI2419385.1 hypothetical protein [Saccharopolyspora soli]